MSEAVGLGGSSALDRLRSRGFLLGELAGICVVAGSLHTALKIFRGWLEARRMHRFMADVPFATYDNTSGFFGFLVDMTKNQRRLFHWTDEISRGHGTVKLIGLPFEPTGVWALVRSPAHVKHILKDNFQAYSKPKSCDNVFFHFIEKWIGSGIFTVGHGQGSEDNSRAWLTQRKMAAGIFTKSNFQNNMSEVFVKKAEHLCNVLQRSAAAGEFVDMQKFFFSFTMDSIMEIFFGEKADTLDGAKCVYGDAYDTAHQCMMDYVNPNLAPLAIGVYLPGPLGGVGGLFWKLHGLCNPTFRRFRRACCVLNKESDRIVAKGRADPGLQHRKDLLALFLQAEERQKFSNEYLRDAVLNFVIAGRDTTACTLTWAVFVLCTNPEVQKALAAEVDEKMPAGTVPTLKGLAANNMPYLNGVLYEVLRLYPPVPQDSKFCFADDVLPDGTKIAKGTTIMYLPYAMGRDPALWKDPEEVRPERWIPFQAPDPYEFPVFQAGPRICLGQDMAIFEAKLVLASLMQTMKFELKAGEREKITYAQTITMALANSQAQDSHNLWARPVLRKP